MLQLRRFGDVAAPSFDVDGSAGFPSCVKDGFAVVGEAGLRAGNQGDVIKGVGDEEAGCVDTNARTAADDEKGFVGGHDCGF